MVFTNMVTLIEVLKLQGLTGVSVTFFMSSGNACKALHGHQFDHHNTKSVYVLEKLQFEKRLHKESYHIFLIVLSSKAS